MAGSVPPTTWTAGNGTRALFSEPDGSGPHAVTAVYQSINMSPPFSGFSFEEMRLQDYNIGLGPPSSLRATQPGKVSLFYGPRSTGYAAAGALHESTHCGFKYKSGARTQTASQAPMLGEHMLRFHVGTDGKCFTVHESAIASRSEFVRLALRHDWKEAQERCISMPEDDPTAFQAYQLWLYSGILFTEPVMDTETDDEYGILVRSYLLGQKLMDSDFKDMVIDAIVAKLLATGLFDIRLTGAVYENTPSTSPLRRLWLDIYQYQGQAAWMSAELDDGDVNAEFLLDFGRRNLSRPGGFPMPQSPAYVNDICQYHEHGDGECYRTQRHSAKVPAFRASGSSRSTTALVPRGSANGNSSVLTQSVQSQHRVRSILPLESSMPGSPP